MIQIAEKVKREKVLYVRIQKKNVDWILKTMKQLGYSSKSEFIDSILTKMQGGLKNEWDWKNVTRSIT